jgi:hypothetical protein
MQLTPTDEWAAKCPRCFGPQQYENKAHPDEPDVIIAMDGNFQQRHYAYASKDNPPESKYPSCFICPSRIAPDATLFTTTEAAAVGIDVSSCFTSCYNILNLTCHFFFFICSRLALTLTKQPMILVMTPPGRNVMTMACLLGLVDMMYH